MHDPTEEMLKFMNEYSEYKKQILELYNGNTTLAGLHLRRTYDNVIKYLMEEDKEVKASMVSTENINRKLGQTERDGMESGWHMFYPKMSEQAIQFYSSDGAIKDILDILNRHVFPVKGVASPRMDDKRFSKNDPFINEMKAYYNPDSVGLTGKLNPVMDAILNSDFSKINRSPKDPSYKQYSGVTFFPDGLKLAKQVMDIGNPNSLLGKVLSGGMPVPDRPQDGLPQTYSPIGREILSPVLNGTPLPNSITNSGFMGRDKLSNFNKDYGRPVYDQINQYVGGMQQRLDNMRTSQGITSYEKEMKDSENKKRTLEKTLGVLNGL